MDKHNDEAIPALDGIRALACILVVVSHIPKYMSMSSGLFDFPIMLGEAGVTIFFSLSGFLMAHLYLSRPFCFNSVLNYSIARFSRIAPAYWIAIVLSFMIYEFIDASFMFHVSTSNLLRHLFFVGSAGVFWSIPPEVQYYVFFIFIWYAWYSFCSGRLLPIVVLFMLAIGMILSRDMWPGILLPSKFHLFFSGSLVALLHVSLKKKFSFKTAYLSLLQVMAAIFLIIGVLSLKMESFAEYYNNSLFFAVVFIFMAAFSFRTPIADALLGTRILRYLGRVSFSVYLFHGIILFLCDRLLILLEIRTPIVDVFVLIFAVALPGIFSIFVELPLCAACKRQMLYIFRSLIDVLQRRRISPDNT